MATLVPTLEKYEEGILKNDPAILGRAITLVESTLPADQQLSSELIKRLLPYTGRSVRIAISGVPGVGKSTFIEAIGQIVAHSKKRVAVLAIDPSSLKTGGSILGDKTRMDELSKNPFAFVRPTPASGHLGGVGGRTREAILLCEAAGYEVILVETVGVGQSETHVRNMVDYFVLLMLAGAGDELQGVKKGILEMADLVVINKCDGENVKAVMKAKTELQHALHLLAMSSSNHEVKVKTVSAIERTGIRETWEAIQADFHRDSGTYMRRRQDQNHAWMEERLYDILERAIKESFALRQMKTTIDEAVRNGSMYPPDAAHKLWIALRNEDA
jgi:LAO/AO transport system kinase